MSPPPPKGSGPAGSAGAGPSLVRVAGEHERQPIELVLEGDALRVEGAVERAFPPGSLRVVALRLELLRIKLDLRGPEGELSLRFPTPDGPRVEALARRVAPGEGGPELSSSLGGFLARELTVWANEDAAAELLGAPPDQQSAPAWQRLAATRQRFAAWALLWGLALPLLPTAGVLWWMLGPDPTNPVSWAVALLLAFAAFNLFATGGLYLQGATQTLVWGWLTDGEAPPE